MHSMTPDLTLKREIWTLTDMLSQLQIIHEKYNALGYAALLSVSTINVKCMYIYAHICTYLYISII